MKITYVEESEYDAIELDTADIKNTISSIWLEQKQVILKKYRKKKYNIEKKLKKRKCTKYNPEEDRNYEEFIMYYNILEMLTIIEEKRQSIYKPSTCSILNRSFDRYMDLGMPSITKYSAWKEPVKYTAFSMTFISALFKLYQAYNGGKASFIASALQALAHLLFAIFFLLNKHDQDLAVPKIIGFIFSSISCIAIAFSGNGYI